MVDKSKKKQRKKRARAAAPKVNSTAPPSSQGSIEDDEDVPKKQKQDSHPPPKEELSSPPQKVLITSSKYNVLSIESTVDSNKRSASPTIDGMMLVDHSYAKEEIEMAVMSCDENLGEVTASGALDSEGDIGMEGYDINRSPELIVVPVDTEIKFTTTTTTAVRKESDSSGTDTAELDDNLGILTVEPELFSEPELEANNSEQSSSDTVNIPATDDDEEGPKEQVEVESRPVEAKRTYSSSRKRIFNNNDNNVTILKPSLDLATASTTLEPDRRILDINRMQLVQQVRAMERSFQVPCIFASCSKPASVLCPSCKKLVYCTEKHRRIAKKKHEPLCIEYRQIDNKSMGIQTITARDIKRACIVMSDEPELVLPMNPFLESRLFPDSYCVNCFTNSVDDYTSSEVTCFKCSLPLCGERYCRPVSCKSAAGNYYDVAPHVESHECTVVTNYVKRGVDRNFILIPDQSVLGLLRCITLPSKNTNDKDAFMDLVNRVKIGPYTKNFESKLQLIRTLFNVDSSFVNEEQLYKLDQALTRYLRNIGADSVTHFDKKSSRPMYVRCFYPTLVHVSHSCVPNCLVVVSNDLKVQAHSVKELKKGELLSVCYDERVLFYPTADRRRYLFREFGILCKCKRCMSPSELDTYFSSYPCSRCSGFLNPVNPLDDYTDWLCYKCKKTPVLYLRVIDVNLNFNGELEQPIRDRDAFGLLELMTELVNGNFLHWNHHIIFHASIKVFRILWEGFIENDAKVIEGYSKTKGLQFLKPVETVLKLTQSFMPDGYADRLLQPTRLAGVIKLRHLTEQLRNNDITLEKLNAVVNEIYYRGYDLSKHALYELWDSRCKMNSKMTESYIKVLEAKVLDDLLNHVMPKLKISELHSRTNAVYKMNELVLKDENVQEVMAHKGECVGIFPYDIVV